MQDISSSLQALSYTNRDFSQIFPELIALTKQISSRWDPSISNESDPGIILLKLNAIIADKCNFSIDTSVLETFPISVTQNNNARNLFEQLGYYMHWYKSATTEVQLTWTGDTVTLADGTVDYIEIPPFTMVTDAEKSVVYSLICPTNAASNVPTNIKFPLAKKNTISCYAIQGISVQYAINQEENITSDLLDSLNRLYFTNTNIAENGVFIANTSSGDNLENFSTWKRKNNLVVENLGNTFFKFGVCNNNSTCYVEFPTDAPSLIGGGIKIVYLNTLGANGNISAGKLEKFYTDISIDSNAKNTFTLTSENVTITNPSSSADGTNVESINDAYVGYKRTCGTFETLITLRDYINYILRSGLVSNCFVCDRTNDVQTSYNIVKYKNGVNVIETQLENEDEDTPYMNAFNLKLYMVAYADQVINREAYLKTYELIKNENRYLVENYINDVKCINHNIQDLLPHTSKSSHFCFFENKFPIECTIQTTGTLTAAQKSELQEKIVQALYQNLNSQKLDFGEKISHAYIKDIILNSDNRIKDLNWDANITGTVYAVYLDYPEDYDPEQEGTDWLKQLVLKKQEISSVDSAPVTINYTYLSPVYKAGGTYAADAYVMHNGNRYHNATGKAISKESWVAKHWEKAPVIFDIDKFKFIDKMATEERGIASYETQEFNFSVTDGWSPNIADYGLTIKSGTGYFPAQNGDKFTAHVSVKTQFQDEILAKSVLSGQTELLVNDEPFDYKISQLYGPDEEDEFVGGIINDISKLETQVEINFKKTSEGGETGTNVYQLKDNEILQMFSPNLLEGTTYGSGVRFEYRLNSAVNEGEGYQLGSDEFVIFYYMVDGTDSEEILSYHAFGENNIIKPSFTMTANTSTIVGEDLVQPGMWTQIVTTMGNVLESSSDLNGSMSATLSQQIQSYVTTRLSSTKTISINYMNKVQLNATNYFYWITNNINTQGETVLFEAAQKWNPNTDDEVFTYSSGHYLYFDNNLEDIYQILKDITEDDNEEASSRTTPRRYFINHGFISPEPLTVQTKLLGNGEYFVYTDSTRQQLAILSSGTTITRPVSRFAWTCDMITLESIVSNGTQALEDYWFNPSIYLSTGEYVEVVENQYINLNPGTYVNIVDKGQNVGGVLSQDVVLGKEDTVLDEFDVWYWSSDITTAVKATTMVLKNARSDDYTWKGRALLTISLNSSKPLILRENQKLIYYQVDTTNPQAMYGAEQREMKDGVPVVVPTTLSETITDVTVLDSVFIAKVGEENYGDHAFDCTTHLTIAYAPIVAEKKAYVVPAIDKSKWLAAGVESGVYEFTFDEKATGRHTIHPSATATTTIKPKITFTATFGKDYVTVDTTTYASKLPADGTHKFTYKEVESKKKNKQSFWYLDDVESSVVELSDYGITVDTAAVLVTGSYLNVTLLNVSLIVDAEKFISKYEIAGTYTFKYQKRGSSGYWYSLQDETESEISLSDYGITLGTTSKPVSNSTISVVLSFENIGLVINQNIFRTKLSENKSYEFIASENEGQIIWKYNDVQVSLEDYGITVGTITPLNNNAKIVVSLTDLVFNSVPVVSTTYGISWTYKEGSEVVVTTGDIFKVTAVYNWVYKNNIVNLTDYGISFEGTVSPEDNITVTYDKASYLYWPVCVLLSTDATVVGSDVVSVVQTASDGTVTYPMLYQFRQKLSTSTGIQQFNDEGYCILKFYADGTYSEPLHQQNVKIALPAGEYIIPVVDTNVKKFITLDVLLDGVALPMIYDETVTEFGNNKTAYVKMVLRNTNEHILTVRIKNTTLPNDHTITLLNPYRYEKPVTMEEKDFQRILKLISILDYSHDFDYTYKVKDADRIDDPLSGISFMRTNHVFNKYTLCMIDENQSLYNNIVIGD